MAGRRRPGPLGQGGSDPIDSGTLARTATPLPGITAASLDAEPATLHRAPVAPRRPYRTLPVLQRGARGSAVERLQAILNTRTRTALRIDGVFGPRTEAAVVDFQRHAALKVDGIVGSRTWTTLNQAPRQAPSPAGSARPHEKSSASSSAASSPSGPGYLVFSEGSTITPRPIAEWSLREKVEGVIELTGPDKLGHELWIQVRGMLTTDALVLIVALMGLLGMLATMASGGLVLALGLTLAFAPALDAFLSFVATTLTAVTREDLEEASDHLAQAIVAGGIAFVLSLLGWAAARRAGGGRPAPEEPAEPAGPKARQAPPSEKTPPTEEPVPSKVPPGRTEPTGEPGGRPTGRRTQIRANDDAATQRSLQRENDSADALAREGYKVEQNPKVPDSKNPDYMIEGKRFDSKAPTTARARNAASEIEKAVKDGQADRIVLNMDDSPIPLDAMKQQLNNYPIEGLKEVIVVKDGKVIPFWP